MCNLISKRNIPLKSEMYRYSTHVYNGHVQFTVHTLNKPVPSAAQCTVTLKGKYFLFLKRQIILINIGTVARGSHINKYAEKIKGSDRVSHTHRDTTENYTCSIGSKKVLIMIIENI